MVDAETLLVGWLSSWLEGEEQPGTVSTETPAGFETQLPWIQVVRIGGGYDGFRLDRPEIDVDAYAADGVAAAALALRIQQALHDGLARTATGGAVVTAVDTITGPHQVPHDNPALRRYTATYQFTLHPQ
ncbi:hypothetical protein [Actinomadura decatromicini]|uniref:DUF3168 domain-containing protein n=1 Tax=Actinomadura decatromicini TaxID=2604572 RepID=A0A5D3FBD9_9ACTN|nr:hypothetical protein [Actinomadura decatromicini]TYK45156.1 hypothetical protein FXF68_31240 [Actinomadura decatromicini]